MKGRRIYLDHNAGSPLRDEARRAMASAVQRSDLGNPSSIHHEGRAARDLVEQARAAVASLVGVDRTRVVFTSGGSEADTLGIETLMRGTARRLVVSRTEHPAVVGTAERLAGRGADVTWLPVDADGQWRVDTMGVGGWRDAVVAVSAVNHETGVRQPFDQLAEVTAAGGGALHVDAVQAAGKFDLSGLAVRTATMALSSHKLGGPTGVGALIVADGLDVRSLTGAGAQERGRRAGTENLIGIVGFGAAATASAAQVSRWREVANLGDRLEAGLLGLGATIAGVGAPRVGGVVNARFAGVAGDALVMALDLAGISASTGAACSSGSLQASPVLMASGVTEEHARGAIRLSLGWSSTDADIDAVLGVLPALLRRIRELVDL